MKLWNEFLRVLDFEVVPKRLLVDNLLCNNEVAEV